MKNNKHLEQEGLDLIISIKAAMNKGLSEEVNKALPNVVPVAIPILWMKKSFQVIE